MRVLRAVTYGGDGLLVRATRREFLLMIIFRI